MLMRVKELRTAANINQQVLADKIGVARNVVSNWETEKSFPKTRYLPLLAKELNCSIDELVVPDVRPNA